MYVLIVLLPFLQFGSFDVVSVLGQMLVIFILTFLSYLRLVSCYRHDIPYHIVFNIIYGRYEACFTSGNVNYHE